ncbi:hypothetical protein HYW67_01135 [Candidatus Parcubacteria bacterium]|nr:hypothetical protein [Candidatus Parcubacteria bacterium]
MVFGLQVSVPWWGLIAEAILIVLSVLCVRTARNQATASAFRMLGVVFGLATGMIAVNAPFLVIPDGGVIAPIVVGITALGGAWVGIRAIAHLSRLPSP